MKPLDMADKYPPADESDIYSDDDEEPTLKVQVPQFHPQVVVKAERSYTFVLCVGVACAITILPLYYIGLYWLLK